MKWKMLLAVILSLAFAMPSMAGEKIITDNDGNKWVIDTETAATPGAGSGEGAIIGAVSDTLASYDSHKFDLQFAVTAMGAGGDDSSGTETALTGFTFYYRPSGAWRVGAAMAWDTQNRSQVTFGIPVGLKLFPNPWSSVNWWINLNILPLYTIQTSDDPLEEGDSARLSAWSWVPSAEFSVEFPMGGWSAEIGLGAGVPVSLEGITDEAENNALKKLTASAMFAINWRMGR